MRKLKAIALSLGLLLGMAGNAFAQLSDVDVTVIVKATDSEFWQIVFDGASAAADVLGVNVSLQGAASEADIAGQINILEDAAAAGADAIVFAPTAFEPLAGPMEDVMGEGIPIIKIDSAADTDAYVSFLATDNYRGGQLAADALAAQIEANTGAIEGPVFLLTALPGVGSLEERDQGFLDRIEEAYPGLEVIDQRFGDNDPGQALATVLDVLTANPDLVGIFADNEPMGIGAGGAIADEGLEDEVALVAFDAAEQQIAYLREGAIDALIVQDPFMMGYGGVFYAVSAAAGVPLPREVDTGVHVVTRDNIDSDEIQGILDASIRDVGF